jgi:hypothetical protein
VRISELEDYAYLSCSGNYSEFDFNQYAIRFRTSSHLRKYDQIKYWDNGYLVVTADYDTMGAVEEYIDLVPMLKNLFIDPADFLKQIKEVRLKNA